MAPRRSHKKSRTGCLSCRRRRVKCDETGPACGPCLHRQIECIYQTTVPFRSYSPAKQSKPASPPKPPKQQPSSPPISPSHPTRDLLELELMNQWSTTTYKSWCGDMTKEYPTWQIILPREALSHSFLLNGMLSFAALELGALPPTLPSTPTTAVSQTPPKKPDYISCALSYHSTALTSFRHALSNPTPEAQQSVIAFSMLTMAISLAIPHFTVAHDEPQSMVANILEHFELLHGVSLLIMQNAEALKDMPVFKNLPVFAEIPANPLDANTTAAIAALNALNETTHNNPGPNLSPAPDPSVHLKAISAHATNRTAIYHLSSLFAKCSEPVHRGLVLAWLNLAGRDFLAAMQEKDPVALVVLMHWGVLMDRCKGDTWWVQPIGKKLIGEIEEALAAERNPRLRGCVDWARAEVGAGP